MTGEDVELVWVKGSGGDLGTLTESGLAVLRLDRMRALTESTRAWTARTRWSRPSTTACTARAARPRPSTPPCTAWSTRAHVDHLHPDSGIAVATAADGEALTKEIFGDRVVWVPWRRPGFQLGLDIAAIKEANPQAVGCILGGHGITAWGETSEESETNSLWIIDTAAAYIAEHTKAEPFGRRGRVRRAPGRGASGQGRGDRAHHPRAGVHGPADGRPLHRRRRRPRLPRLGRAPAARRARHLLPRPLPAHQGQADAARPARDRVGRGADRAAEGAARALPRGLPGLLRPQRERRTRRRSGARTR